MSELGTSLVRAREARGLTLEDAERDTRISRRYLQALESEQFEAIPAPVYARGFLRSYSQYLGLDPTRMLELFPREDDYDSPYQRETQQRASPENPISAVSASRPTWRRPQPTRPGASPRDAAPSRPREQPPIRDRAVDDEQEADERYQRRQYREDVRDPEPPPRRPPARAASHYEPVIGIDLGVPAPARRIKRDPAAQTRTLAVVGVAIGAIIVVILIAFLLSRAGGSAAGIATPTPAAAITQNDAAVQPATTPVNHGGQATVPDVLNLQQGAAETAIQKAGLKAQVSRQSATQPAGTVINQAPSGDSPAAAGDTVYLVVSSGQ